MSIQEPSPYKEKLLSLKKNIEENPSQAGALRRDLLRLVDKNRREKRLKELNNINEKYRIYFDTYSNKFALEIYEKRKRTIYFNDEFLLKNKLCILLKQDKENININ